MTLFGIGHKKDESAANTQGGRDDGQMRQDAGIGSTGHHAGHAGGGHGQQQQPQAYDYGDNRGAGVGGAGGVAAGGAQSQGIGGHNQQDQGLVDGGRHEQHHGILGGKHDRAEGRGAGTGAGAGGLVGSQAIHGQAAQLEQQAQTYRAQGNEISEAERLEQEARTRRDRAVAQGAPQENRHLGAGGHTQGQEAAGHRF